MDNKIKEDLKKYIAKKRYNHTLAVEEECAVLAKIFSLDEINKQKLLTAALLHDITKELEMDEHIALCKKFGIIIQEEYIRKPILFHAKTGAAFALALYPDKVDDIVFNCIIRHTTGSVNMTLCEKLLYLADYIEPTRQFEDCVKLRKIFYDKIYNCSDKHTWLDETLVKSFDMTILDLINNGDIISSDTVLSRNYLIMGMGVLNEIKQ